MYLTGTELKSTMHDYQLQEITDSDNAITEMAINTAVEEVKSYLSSNNQSKFTDGRLRYDVEAVFNATGTDRNALILETTKTVAEWWIIRLSNVDILFDQVKERYDRAIEYLTKVNSGEVTISTLPVLDPEGDNIANQLPFRSGSRPKFNHY